MADSAKPEKLTLGQAITDLGWFAWLFTLVVGPPSILQILQLTAPSYQLVPLLQWIPDGWAELMAAMGAVIEPLIQPAIDWINARLDWRLTLDPIWRPLFTLGMVIVLGAVRSNWRAGRSDYAAVIGIVTGCGALIGAVLAGLAPSDGGWWAQGLRAAAPMAGIMTLLVPVNTAKMIARGDAAAARKTLSSAVFALTGFALGAFALAAGLSFIPGLGAAAGVLSLAVIVLLFGVTLVVGGLVGGGRVPTRFGLTILGGFVAAGMILAADQAVKALGAG